MYDSGMDKNISVNKREFEDIVLSAMRYALPRHSYILDSTCHFVRLYASELFTERVYSVMLHDVTMQLDAYKNETSGLWKNDREYIEKFRDWLVSYGEENGYRSAWGEGSF